MRLRFAAAPVALALLAGCAERDSGAPAEAVVVRDSAGVRITESAAPLLPRGAWSVSPQPSPAIGTADGEPMQLLDRVVGGVVLSDGRIVISNQSEPMIRWYAPDGTFLVGTGRRGDGPGELRGNASLLRLRGDSVAVWENSGRRAHVFGPDGGYVRAVSLAAPAEAEGLTFRAIVGASEDGYVERMHSRADLTAAVGTRVRLDAHLLAYHSDGSFAGRIAVLPGLEFFIAELHWPGLPAPTRSEGRAPFPSIPVVSVHDDRLYYGPGERYEIAVHDLGGGLRSLIRRLGAERPLPREAREADLERRLAAPEPELSVRPGPEDLTYPELLPPYRRLILDPDGWIWVQDYEPPGADSAAWSVFDPHGRWITEVELPSSWEVLEVGREYVLALTRDDLGVERVGRFALRRVGP